MDEISGMRKAYSEARIERVQLEYRKVSYAGHPCRMRRIVYASRIPPRPLEAWRLGRLEAFTHSMSRITNLVRKSIEIHKNRYVES